MLIVVKDSDLFNPVQILISLIDADSLATKLKTKVAKKAVEKVNFVDLPVRV